jgi:gentisate 1,2-dioxygenase
LAPPRPIFSYPYERSREALDRLERDAPLDDWDGFKLRYINPLTGGSPMPTMATFMQRLPPGFSGNPWRQTDGAVYSVVEGQGEIVIVEHAGTKYVGVCPARSFRDALMAHCALQIASGCVLFSYSDRPVHQALGIHQEERLS